MTHFALLKELMMLKAAKSFETGMPILDVSEVIELERRTAEGGTSLLTLMKRAGAAVAETAAEMLGEGKTPRERIAILAGSGNNGGDGWVAAARLADEGYNVTLVSKAPADALTAEPARTAAMEAAHGNRFKIAVSPVAAELAQLLSEADLIIDAVLGTGFAHSEVREPYVEWIDLANTARNAYNVPILAVDCPSGLNAQTGSAASSCIDADKTITMIAAKAGLVQADATAHVGTLLVAPIGVEA